jgi:hypothetical protein
MATDRIVAFYTGGTDDRGRTLDGILDWPDDSLERVHDYIQWVFPTAAPSAVNPLAPLVTDNTVAAFTSPELKDRLRRALDRMLKFYGLQRETGPTGHVVIAMDGARFAERSVDWLRPGNHNHLRLTRIMQSLWVLGLRAEARALRRCLIADVYPGPGRNRITRETYEFWLEAIDR